VSGSLKETILVVDDREDVLKAVVTILEHAKFHVLAARGGTAALKLAEETDERFTCSFPTWTCRGCQARTLARR
jgi:CheY-like chemotaxis protein